MPTGKITNYGAAQVMNFIFGGVLMNVPQTWYAAYCMGTCSPSAMGAEPTGAGYERKAISNTNAVWSPSTLQSKTNLADILWNPAEANQGNVQAIVLYDSPVNGNPWFYFPLPSPKTIEDGDAMTVPAGALTIKFLAGLLSNVYNNQLLNYLLGGVSMNTVPNYWVGYTTSANSGVNAGSEPASGGYARAQIPNAAGMFTGSSTGNKTTALDITFPEATASQGTAIGLAFFTAVTGGTFVGYASMPGRGVDQATTPFIPAGSITLLLE